MVQKEPIMTIFERAASTALYRTASALYGTARFISRIATRLTKAGEKVSGTYYDDGDPF